MKITSATFVQGVVGPSDILLDGRAQFAFVGRSNVGKSSLINALTGVRDLARVGKKPGKTTEINFFLVNKKVYIVDLPGYGFADASGSERGKLKKLIIWYLTFQESRPATVAIVLDVKAGLTTFDRDMILILKDQKLPFVIVVNKIDKLTQKEVVVQIASIRESAGDAEILLCSTQTGKGIDAVRERLFAGGVSQ
jgi:GTP-binding protein